eukprot:138725-Prymnesium_polylepis.1
MLGGPSVCLEVRWPLPWQQPPPATRIRLPFRCDFAACYREALRLKPDICLLYTSPSPRDAHES